MRASAGADPQRSEGGIRRLLEGAGIELIAITQANHQHARGGHARQAVQQRGLAGLAADVARLDQRLEAAFATQVELGGAAVQRVVRKEANHHAIAVDFSRMRTIQGKFECHAVSIPYNWRLCGRRIGGQLAR